MQTVWIILVMVLIWANSSEAACTGMGTSWSCPVGATSKDVDTALAAASDGATITFAAGSYTWGDTTFRFSNTKGVTLDGGNKNAVVTITSPGTVAVLEASGINKNTYRITGFTFQNAPSQVIFWFYGLTGAVVNNLRVDHNTFSNFNAGSVPFLLGANGPFSTVYGLFDHNLLTGPTNFQLVKTLGVANPSSIPASIRGTIANTFVEDNTFQFDTMTAGTLGSGCVDIWNAAGMVFRHNTVLNCQVTAHGSMHGGGAINFELYGNTLQMNNGSITPDGYRLFHHQGSGELVAYRNTFIHSTSPLNIYALDLNHYRSADCGSGSLYDCGVPRCDGSNANTSTFKDGSRSPIGTYVGYPCWFQPGRRPNGGVTTYGSLSPIYTWQNVDQSTGNTVPLGLENFSHNTPFITNHIKPNRDYYDAISGQAQNTPTSPFNGTIGMGFGILANRPATCTTGSVEEPGFGGVGYFATDQGTQGILYRCSAINTWTVQYTPFPYPHPLQASGGGGGGATSPTPTNLRVQ